MSTIRELGWQVVALLNEDRKKRGLRPLSWERVGEVLSSVRRWLMVEDSTSSGEEAIQAARGVLEGLAARLGVKRKDLMVVVEYWHGKGRIGEDTAYVLTTLLERGDAPGVSPEELRRHVGIFVEKASRSLLGRGQARLRRMGLKREAPEA